MGVTLPEEGDCDLGLCFTSKPFVMFDDFDVGVLTEMTLMLGMLADWFWALELLDAVVAARGVRFLRFTNCFAKSVF